MSFLKGWKTVVLGVLVGVIGTIRAIATPEDAASAPTPEEVEAGFDAVTFAIGWGEAVVIWVIRAITNSPIFKKEPPAPPPVE